MISQTRQMGFSQSFSIYIPAALFLFIETKYLIPFLSDNTGQETVLFWFIVAGLGIFLPLVITAVLILKSEGYNFSKDTWSNRLRFKRMGTGDLLWSIGGIIIILIFSASIMEGLEYIIGNFDHSPPFMSFEPLTSGRYWLLIIWFPYWLLNILGEEILWRGVMLPRQETAFGKYAWLINALGWWLFHIAFGWQLMVTLAPIIFIQSYIVQKTGNTWTGVIIHGGINGPSFLAIAFGLI